MLEHRNKKGKLQNSFSLKLEGVEIWYFVRGISLWASTKFVHKMPLGSKLAPPWGSQFEHRKKERNIYNSSLKLDGLELWYLVCIISLWTFTKFVYIMHLGGGLVLLWGVTNRSIGTKKTNFIFFLLWKWKAYSFDFWYVVYPSGSLPSFFIWPRPEDHMLEHRNKADPLQNSTSLKLDGRELWYLVCNIS